MAQRSFTATEFTAECDISNIVSAVWYQLRRVRIIHFLQPSRLLCAIDRWPMDSPHKGPITRKMFPFNDVIMRHGCIELHQTTIHAYRMHNSWDALVQRDFPDLFSAAHVKNKPGVWYYTIKQFNYITFHNACRWETLFKRQISRHT